MWPTGPDITYGYDPLGNLSLKNSLTYTYNSGHAHAVSSLSSGNTYSYDQNGNMTSRHIVNGTQTQDFALVYDAENRLVSVTGSATANFVYDGDGRQFRATTNNVTTLYVGAHYQKQGTSVTKHYFAGAQRIAVRKDGTLSFLLGDHLGSSSVTTNANGAQPAIQLYKAWGESRYSSGNLNMEFKFTGQREEASLGLYFYQSRWMDPQLGRFIQADTVAPGGVQGLDRYNYVNNSPVNYTDPSGHEAEWCNGNALCLTLYRESYAVFQVDLASYQSLNQYAYTYPYHDMGCGFIASSHAGASVEEIATAAGDSYSAEYGIQPSYLAMANSIVYGSNNVVVKNFGEGQGYNALLAVALELEAGKKVTVDLLVDGSYGNYYITGNSGFAHFARVLAINFESGYVYLENSLGGGIFRVPIDVFLAAWNNPEQNATRLPPLPQPGERGVFELEQIGYWFMSVDTSGPYSPYDPYNPSSPSRPGGRYTPI